MPWDPGAPLRLGPVDDIVGVAGLAVGDDDATFGAGAEVEPSDLEVAAVALVVVAAALSVGDEDHLRVGHPRLLRVVKGLVRDEGDGEAAGLVLGHNDVVAVVKIDGRGLEIVVEPGEVALLGRIADAVVELRRLPGGDGNRVLGLARVSGPVYGRLDSGDRRVVGHGARRLGLLAEVVIPVALGRTRFGRRRVVAAIARALGGSGRAGGDLGDGTYVHDDHLEALLARHAAVNRRRASSLLERGHHMAGSRGGKPGKGHERTDAHDAIMVFSTYTKNE